MTGQRDAGRAARPDYPEIGERLRARRHERGLSLRELADRLGVLPEPHQPDRARAGQSIGLAPSTPWSPSSTSRSTSCSSTTSRASVATTREPSEAARARVPDPARRRSGTASASRRGVLWERLTTVSEPGVEFLYVTTRSAAPRRRPMRSSATPATSGATSSRARSRSRSGSTRVPARSRRCDLPRLDDAAPARERRRRPGPCDLVRPWARRQRRPPERHGDLTVLGRDTAEAGRSSRP